MLNLLFGKPKGSPIKGHPVKVLFGHSSFDVAPRMCFEITSSLFHSCILLITGGYKGRKKSRVQGVEWRRKYDGRGINKL